MTLFGRRSILARIDAIEREVANDARPRVILLSGRAGYGKTALLAQLDAGFRASSNTVVLRATCEQSEGSRPWALIRTLLRDERDSLTRQYPQYVSGLEPLFESAATFSSDRLELGFIRLCSELAKQLNLILLIDDAQWIDEESTHVFRTLLARRGNARILLILASRPGQHHPSFTGTVSRLELPPLADDATRCLVRENYPEVNSEVEDAIVACSSGVALSTLVLAQQARSTGAQRAEDIAPELTDAIREDLFSLTAGARDILHVCSFLREPVAYGVLASIAGPNEARMVLDPLVPRYLIPQPGGFAFIHSLVRDAVRQTLGCAAPLQHAALSALRALEVPRLHEILDMVELAETLGDATAAHQTALRLAARASRESDWHLAAEAYKRALTVDPIVRPQLVERYVEYAGVLRLLERHDEAREFLEKVLASLIAAKQTKGIGPLAAALANVMWTLGDLTAALSVCERFARFVDGPDREEIDSVALSLRVLAGDASLIASTEYEALTHSWSSRIATRLLSTRSVVHARQGNHEGMIRDLARITAQEAMDRSVSGEYIRDLRLVCQWNERGVDAVRESLLAGIAGNFGSLSWQVQFLTLVDFASGRGALALERIREIAIERFTQLDRDRVLVPCAAILALDTDDVDIFRLIERRAHNALGNRSFGDAAEIAMWYAISPRSQRLTADEVKHICDWIAGTKILESLYPIEFGYGLFAEKYSSALPAIHRVAATPRSPWFRANFDIALGWVERDAALLGRGAASMRALGAHKIASLASERISSDTVSVRVQEQRGTDTLTPREREVCTLLTDGLTNRAIALRLFVSERTVETHVSNALSKLGARTRTELARRLTAV